MYLGGTPDEDRLAIINQQLHGLGLAIAQAQARGDQAAVDALTPYREQFQREAAAIIARRLQQSNAAVAAAQAGPLGINTLLAQVGNIGKWAIVGAGVLLAWRLLRR